MVYEESNLNLWKVNGNHPVDGKWSPYWTVHESLESVIKVSTSSSLLKKTIELNLIDIFFYFTNLPISPSVFISQYLQLSFHFFCISKISLLLLRSSSIAHHVTDGLWQNSSEYNSKFDLNKNTSNQIKPVNSMQAFTALRIE